MMRLMNCLIALMRVSALLSAAETAPVPVDSLKAAFAKRFEIGAAIPGTNLRDAEKALLFKHFSTVTPENCLKPQPVHPDENRYDFAAGDALVEMARSNGLTVNGHTLIWHSQCPNWFFTDNGKPAERELVLKRMREHIAGVAGRYAGKLASWDVVNEAIDDGKEYLRKSKWLTSIGDDFIAEAFVAARQADPKAELLYNDYGIEQGAKREKALRLIRDLKKRNAPIAGVGIQGHWALDRVPFKAIEEAIIAFHAEGLKVSITELDIDVVPRKSIGADVSTRENGSDDPYVNGLPPDVQKRLADQYAQLFALFLKHSDKMSRVTFWGLHDGRSWLNGFPRRRTNHPLLFDRSLQPKPALEAVLEMVKK